MFKKNNIFPPIMMVAQGIHINNNNNIPSCIICAIITKKKNQKKKKNSPSFHRFTNLLSFYGVSVFETKTIFKWFF